ncbi:MAG TPA: hypothetical protein PLD20_08195 [Blastocatellia bacterium]|nr:hypothetical protein [Blastocatellia bacterium]HMV85255.1 hypothetical protein [Blastocatellia bacterium]HMX25240.1 hypothetical protein [Blastocatellia bacterium]HMY73492.1 hypothetical protein [Blastocatellia bacterium]HMZ17894.1 hypothetical protein [Blastocatellia bacterium]
MAYSKFSMTELEREFQLRIVPQVGLFSKIPTRTIGNLLAQILEEQVPLASMVGTEKARAELIIAPMLVELRRQMNHQISFFSGVDFPVDTERGLSGYCDFLLTRSTQQFEIEAPVVVLLEAKNDNIKSGLPQCIAEMVAAQIFNEQRQNPMNAIYGSVTTGNRWVFLKLEDKTVQIDLQEYGIEEPNRILGILLSMVSQSR